MALNDILIKIKKETEEKIKKIKEEADLKLREMGEDYDKKISTEKEKILHQVKQVVDKKNRQEQIKISLETKNVILVEKQKMLDELWQEVLNELSLLEDEKYLALMVELLKKCPTEKGMIMAVNGREKITRQAIKESRRHDVLSGQTISGQGGFIYISDNVEINATFKELIKEMQGELILELNKSLFNN